MTFGEKMKEMLEQGAAVTKDFAVKAGAKAQDLGERGVLLVEIKQLEYQVGKLISRMGAEVYQCFAERWESTVSSENIIIKDLLSQIASAKEQIEQKESEIALRKNKTGNS